MIPEFNKDGCLPKGVYKATLEEIKEKFGKGSARREKLFRGIVSVVKLLREHKGSVSRFLLNGSYVTSKEEPGDFDYILILKNDFDLDSPEARQLLCSEELFNAHMLFAMEEDTTECQEVIGFFGHDREARSKGLVEVIL